MINPSDLTARRASQILYSLVTTNEAKLRRGLQARNQIMEAIQRGEVPQGPRAIFLKTGVARLNKTLQEIAQDFNDLNPEDRASVQDMVDLLEAVLARYKKKL